MMSNRRADRTHWQRFKIAQRLSTRTVGNLRSGINNPSIWSKYMATNPQTTATAPDPDDNPDECLTVEMATDSARKDKLISELKTPELVVLSRGLLVPEMADLFTEFDRSEPTAEWTDFDQIVSGTFDFQIDPSHGELGLRLGESTEARFPGGAVSPYFSSWQASRRIGKNLFPVLPNVQSSFPVFTGSGIDPITEQPFTRNEAAMRQIVRCIRHIEQHDPGELQWLLLTCDVPAADVARFLGKALPEV